MFNHTLSSRIHIIFLRSTPVHALVTPCSQVMVERTVGAYTIPKGDVVMMCLPAGNKEPPPSTVLLFCFFYPDHHPPSLPPHNRPHPNPPQPTHTHATTGHDVPACRQRGAAPLHYFKVV